MTHPAEFARRLTLYLQAAATTRSFNWKGFPLLPKSAQSPSSRVSYNSFIAWIGQLKLTSAACIFDVGANHGDFSQAAADYYPEAQIWLFEPLPALWAGLRQLASARRGRWNVQPFALGNIDGSLPLQTADQDDGIASFVGFSEDYRRGNPNVRQTHAIETRVERLDGFCARNRIQSIDLLKIDVEGFEFDVLAGAEEMLRHTTALIVEISLIRQTGGAADALERMIALLSQSGFHIVDVIPSLFSPEEPWKPLEYNLLARR